MQLILIGGLNTNLNRDFVQFLAAKYGSSNFSAYPDIYTCLGVEYEEVKNLPFSRIYALHDSLIHHYLNLSKEGYAIIALPSRDYTNILGSNAPVWLPEIKSLGSPIIVLEDTTHEGSLSLKERRAWEDFSYKSECPLLVVDSTNQSLDDTKAQILAFIKSHEKAQEEKEFNLPFSQEIQVNSLDIDLETQQEMKEYLEGIVGYGRVQPRWETWAGLYFTPPTDGPLWTQEEFEILVKALKAHSNVKDVDVPTQGTLGHAKSTR